MFSTSRTRVDVWKNNNKICRGLPAAVESTHVIRRTHIHTDTQTHALHQHGVELHFPGRSKDFEAECESLLWFSVASVLSGLFFSFFYILHQSK